MQSAGAALWRHQCAVWRRRAVSRRRAMTERGFRLHGRRALITGAGRGLGLAMAEALAGAGAAVTLCARTASEIEAAAERLRGQGHQAEALQADVTNPQGLAGRLAERPAFDILVNNAGTNRPKPLSEIT